MKRFLVAVPLLLLLVPAASLGRASSPKTTTIELLQKTVSSSLVNAPEGKPAAGTGLVLAAELQSPKNGTTVGHAYGFCVLVNPGSGEYECQILNELSGGDLIGSGPFTPGKPGVAVISGTGSYAGDTGQVTLTPKSETTIALSFTLHKKG